MNCHKKAKKGFTILELLVVIFLSSIVLIYTFSFAKQLFQTQNENEKIASLKIDLNSTKIIIEKNLPASKDLLKYENMTLFYGENILLQNVTKYQETSSSNILTIDITLNNTINQTWKFEL